MNTEPSPNKHNSSPATPEKDKSPQAPQTTATTKTGSPTLYDRAMALYRYFTEGVWESNSRSFRVTLVKTLSLSVRSFMDRGLQTLSTSLTYNTVLAIVPALALVFAICRGFGFQNLLQDTMEQYMPGQEHVIDTVLVFVDSYLKQSSQGIFVGVGVVALLWTVISLLSNIEQAFNNIWDIKRDRTFFQKVTAYISLCLMVPVLIICSSGLSIFMSTTLQEQLHIPFLTPLINVVLEFMPLVLIWLAFSLSYLLIPNTKVEFRCAAIAGAVCAVMFQVLQLLYVNGQLYVSKYNAIYGSFAFLPLLLVWLQLSWLVLLFGCVLTYSLQNVFAFNYLGTISNISHSYMRCVTLVISTVVMRRFADRQQPLSRQDISKTYGLPMRLVGYVCWRLKQCNLVNYVILPGDDTGISAAVEPSSLSVGELFSRLDSEGEKDFIPHFGSLYAPLIDQARAIGQEAERAAQTVMVADLPLPTPAQLKEALEDTLQNNKRKKQK